MFCPVCKAEYRPGFTRCSDCDVNLVERLEVAATADNEQDDNATVLWSGTDPQTFTLIRGALDSAKILHYAQTSAPGTLPGLRDQFFTIRVSNSDREAADAAMDGVRPQSGAENQSDDEAGGSPDDINELPDSNDSGATPDDIVEDFKPDEATAEIWSGDDRDLAEMFRMSLRENGIGCVVDRSGGKNTVRVMPESEARAKEIVREILEGTPPS